MTLRHIFTHHPSTCLWLLATGSLFLAWSMGK